ncbi:MAG: cytochrome c, partial [Actinomycetota bacterium]
LSQDDIYQVIEEGRGAMPSWSIRYQGALNDQQVNDLVVYLVQMSSENVPFEDNVCLNEEASTRALDEATVNPRDP